MSIQLPGGPGLGSGLNMDGTSPVDPIDDGSVVPWAASTRYVRGALALNPSGQLIRRKSSGVSGATYDSSLWDIVGGSGGGTVDKAAVVATGVSVADLGGKTSAQSDATYAPTDLAVPVFVVPKNGRILTDPNQPVLYGDGINDDAPAVNYCIAKAAAAGGGIVQVPVGTWWTFSTIFLGFLPVAANPTTWTTANTPTALADGDALPATYVTRQNITLRGAGMYATKIVRAADVVGVDVSGMAGTNNSVNRFARSCNIEDLNLYGGMPQRGIASTKPVLRHYYATLCTARNVDILDAVAGWRIVQCWDSQFHHVRVDNCGGNPSATYNSVVFTPNATPTTPAMQIYNSVPGVTTGNFGFGSDSANNLKFRDLTIESYRDGALWIDGSAGFVNGCNGLTFSDLKIDTTSTNGPSLVITAGLGGNNDAQRKNYNIHVDGLVLIPGNPLIANNGNPWDAVTIQDTAGFILKNAVIQPGGSGNGPPMKNAITLNGNNVGLLLENVGVSGSSSVTGTPTYPLAVLNFASGQNDVNATAWGRWDRAGGQLPLLVGAPTTGTLSAPIYGKYAGNGTDERTASEYGGLTRWGPVAGMGFGLAQTGDAFARFRAKNDGSVEIGPGNAARDTILSRVAAGVLRVANALSVVGLTGATAGARFVGGTVSGAPATGTFVAGDFIVAQNGKLWVCTVGGTPGTWVGTA